MSSKPNKNKLVKGNKPSKVNKESNKAKESKLSKISSHKPMKKNTKQLSKNHQLSVNQKFVETNNNNKLQHCQRRSATVKKPYTKENARKPTSCNAKINPLRKCRSKSVNDKDSTSREVSFVKANSTTKYPPLTRASSDTRYDPKQMLLPLKTKSQANYDSILLQNKPVLRTKAGIPDTKTQEGRRKIAKETMKIMYGANSGKYIINQHGISKTVDISDKMSNCVKNTETIINVQYDTWNVPELTESSFLIEVRPESSFGAARRLASRYKTCVLNFASSTKPGGSFINGKTAQEESLSRQSALFKSLQKEKFMYMHHKINKSDYKYSDYMIYSPSVPVFRDDKTEKLLPENDVFCTDVITSAAPNKAEMVKHGQSTKYLYNILYIRCEKILRCAIDHGVKALVLGAFGCDAFGNDPKEVSQIFKDLLVRIGYIKYFKAVIFAIADASSKNFKEFKKTFRGV